MFVCVCVCLRVHTNTVHELLAADLKCYGTHSALVHMYSRCQIVKLAMSTPALHMNRLPLCSNGLTTLTLTDVLPITWHTGKRKRENAE